MLQLQQRMQIITTAFWMFFFTLILGLKKKYNICTVSYLEASRTQTLFVLFLPNTRSNSRNSVIFILSLLPQNPLSLLHM